MAFDADFELKEQVRSAVDIVDVVGQQLELRRQGRNYVARCPWHDDRRPSLVINPERQTWRCWVCDIGGDIFSYVMQRDGLSFPEALQLLGEMAGIPVEQMRARKPAAPGTADDKLTLLSAMKWAVDKFHQFFLNSEDAAGAREYAASRSISADSIEKFQIGYAPDSWDWLLSQAGKEGFSGEILHACGLAQSRNSGSGHYDLFRNRLIFPIFDLQGRPISAGGRVLPFGESFGGKYINGPETKLFSKSKQLYGLNWARDAILKEQSVLVMEGYTDVLGAVQAGIEHCVAVLGTALGEGHIRILKRFADNVVLVLDGDRAGQRRADEVLELFVGADVDLRVLTLPEGQDPADFVAQHGAEPFLAEVRKAPDAIEHKLQRLTHGVDLATETHRATKALETMLAILAKSNQDVSDLRMHQSLLRLARTFSVDLGPLQQRLKKLRENRRAQSRRRPSVPAKPENKSEDRSGQRPPESDRSVAAVIGGWIGGEDDDPGPYPDGGFDTPPVEPQAREQRADDKIEGLDREFFELLIERPDFVGRAVESIEARWLSSDSSEELLRVYQNHELLGMSLDVRDILLTIENETLKSQVVTMDSRVQDKSELALQSPEARFESVLNRYREFDQQVERRQQLARLDQGLGSDEELSVLDELIAAQRLRQGLTGQDGQDS